MGPLRAMPTLLLRTEVGMERLVVGLSAEHTRASNKRDALGRVWLQLESQMRSS